MSAVIAILWFLALLASVQLVFWCCGVRGLVQMFPEGNRWWILPACFASLAVFAVVVLLHPFGGAA